MWLALCLGRFWVNKQMCLGEHPGMSLTIACNVGGASGYSLRTNRWTEMVGSCPDERSGEMSVVSDGVWQDVVVSVHRTIMQTGFVEGMPFTFVHDSAAMRLAHLITAPLAFGAVAALLPVATASAADTNTLHINEILVNPEGTDSPKEYVELKGAPSAVIPANTYLVFIEANTTAPGDVQNIFNLSGLTLGSNGFLVIRQNGSPYPVAAGATVVTGTGTGFSGAAGFLADTGTDIENEGYTALLINSATAPTLANDVDANNDGTTDGTVYGAWTVLDGVAALDTATASPNFAYAPASFFDGEWVGRPTGDPSGLVQSDWVGSGFSNTQTVIPFAIDETTVPASYSGKLLDHVGGPNFPAPETEVDQFSNAALIAMMVVGAAGAAVVLRRRPRTI
jgi:hypothetical protein